MQITTICIQQRNSEDDKNIENEQKVIDALFVVDYDLAHSKHSPMNSASIQTTAYAAPIGFGWSFAVEGSLGLGRQVVRERNHRMCLTQPKPTGEPGAS